MRLTIDAAVLAAATGDAAKAIPRNPHIPILACLSLETDGLGTLVVSGYDYDTSVTATVPVLTEATPARWLLPGRALAAFASRLHGDVVLTVEGSKATLVSKRTRITLATLDPHDYPAMPDPEPATITVDGGALADAVATVLVAVDNGDSGRPELTGILLTTTGGWLGLTGTDGYTLLHRQVTMTAAPGLLTALPSARMLYDLTRNLTGDVRLGLDEKGMSIATADRAMTLRPLAADYPDVLGRFAGMEASTTVDLGRAELLDALDLAKTTTTNRNLPLRLDITETGLDYRAGDAEAQLLGSLDGTVVGPGLTILVNPRRLADITRVQTTDRITLGLTKPDRPLTVVTTDGISLVMPIVLPQTPNQS